jgi:photosystem II stability/assembly factor-like uncharacterized protein
MNVRYCVFILLIGCFTIPMPLNAQWGIVFNPTDGNYGVMTDIESYGGRLYIGTSVRGVYYSNDNADTDNWTKVNTGLTDTSITFLAVVGSDIYAGTASGLFGTTNGGASWAPKNSGLAGSNVQGLVAIGSNLFVANSPHGIFLSTNNGETWNQRISGLTDTVVSSIVVHGTSLFITTNIGVFRSTDEGASWTQQNTGLPSFIPYSLFATPAAVYILTAGFPSGAVLRSLDNGVTWDSAMTGLPSTSSRIMAASGSNVFTGNYSGGFYLSTDNGTSWTAVNSGYGTVPPRSMGIHNGYLFSGGFDAGLYRRLLSQMVTSVIAEPGELPSRYSLYQNYPNPFNPETRISFDIPEATNVAVKVFDLFGRTVAILVNERLSAGTYTANWNATGFASGLYYYQIQAGNFIEAKKMFLLK